MALIICKECGKKVSDTVKECIHCGATLEPKAQSVEHAQNDTPEEERLVDFNDLTSYQQKKHIEDFLKTDRMARKARNYLLSAPDILLVSFLSLIFLCITSVPLILRSITIPIINYEITVANRDFWWLALYVWATLSILCSIALVSITVKQCVRSTWIKKVKSEINFTKYLKDEGIYYSPQISNQKEMDIYNELLEGEN